MVHDGIGQLQVKRVLDEVEHGFAPRRLSPQLDKSTQVGDNPTRTVERLLVHGFEKHMHV
jgi:hypothetical protein